MATCDATALTKQAACVYCGLPPGLQWPAVIALMCQWAHQPTDPTSLAALVQKAQCVNCSIPAGEYMPVMINLLCLAAGFGSGGGGQPIPPPPAFSFSSLAWDNPADIINGTASQNVFTGNTVKFSATLQTGTPSSITNSNTNSPILYTGPATAGNFNAVLVNSTNINNARIQITQGGVVLVNQTLARVDGSQNIPFNLSAGTNSPIVVTCSLVLNGGAGGTVTTETITLTP